MGCWESCALGVLSALLLGVTGVRPGVYGALSDEIEERGEAIPLWSDVREEVEMCLLSSRSRTGYDDREMLVAYP